MHEAGYSKPVLWTTQTDGMGTEVGGGFKSEGYMYTHG